VTVAFRAPPVGVRERVHHWKADNLALLARLGKLRTLSLSASAARDFSFVASMRDLTAVDLSQTSLRRNHPLRDVS
jgi:hypothetical protein